MENYDSVIGFDYTNREEWRSWVKDRLLPIYKHLSLVLKLRERLEDELVDLNEALNRESVRVILLGGVSEEGEYKPNSLAKLYKEVLGVFINPKEWVAYCKTGVNPADKVECCFEDTEFLKFASEVIDLVEMIAGKMWLKIPNVGEGEVEELLASPEKLADVVREIYRLMASVTPNCDYHTFFVLSVYCIPKFYVREAYPKLKEKLDSVMDILELEEKFTPETENDSLRDDLTLIGHRKGGFADLVYRLNWMIWKAYGKFWSILSIRMMLKAIGIQVVDLERDYYKNIKKTLERYGWDAPNYIHTNTNYDISGIIVTRYYDRYIDIQLNISLYMLLQDTSPALLLHYYKLEVENNNLIFIWPYR